MFFSDIPKDVSGIRFFSDHLSKSRYKKGKKVQKRRRSSFSPRKRSAESCVPFSALRLPDSPCPPPHFRPVTTIPHDPASDKGRTPRHEGCPSDNLSLAGTWPKNYP